MIYNRRNSLLIAFISIIFMLITIGLIFIYSSSSVYALERCGSSSYYVKKQLFGVLLGLIGMCIGAVLPLQLIKKLTPYFFLSSLLLTALTLVIGVTIHGSSRWIYIKEFGFQPSELLKISFILYCSYFLAKKGERIYSLIQGYIPYMCLISLTCLLLLKQPDFGQAVTLASTGLLLFFIAGGQLRYLAATVIGLLPILGLLIFLKPYRLRRVLTFLNPWQDPHGAGFQIIQSLIAIGSGSFWGVGIGQSKQKFFYLPMQHTDFIFSIIAEEVGFMGSLFLLMLYITFLYIGIKVALSLYQDRFAYLVTLGFIFLTSLQAVINLCVATGLLPTKGIGLPFISYGISSLFCSLCLLGVIINAYVHRVSREYYVYSI